MRFQSASFCHCERGKVGKHLVHVFLKGQHLLPSGCRKWLLLCTVIMTFCYFVLRRTISFARGKGPVNPVHFQSFNGDARLQFLEQGGIVTCKYSTVSGIPPIRRFERWSLFSWSSNRDYNKVFFLKVLKFSCVVLCVVLKVINSHFQLSSSLAQPPDLACQFVSNVIRSLLKGFLQHPFKLLEHASLNHCLCAARV